MSDEHVIHVHFVQKLNNALDNCYIEKKKKIANNQYEKECKIVACNEHYEINIEYENDIYTLTYDTSNEQETSIYIESHTKLHNARPVINMDFVFNAMDYIVDKFKGKPYKVIYYMMPKMFNNLNTEIHFQLKLMLHANTSRVFFQKLVQCK